MAGIPINLASGGEYWTRISLFVKFTAHPSAVRTLVDLDGGSIGNLRVVQNTDGHILVGGGYGGNSGFHDLTPTISMYTDKWYWVSAAMGCFAGDNFCFFLCGQVTGPGAITDGFTYSRFATAASTRDLVDCLLGWGVTLTTFDAAFPFNVGDQMDCLVIDTNSDPAGGHIDSIGPWPPPVGNIDPTLASPGTGVFGHPAQHPLALYLCGEPAGTTSGLVDSSGNHYDLTPGPQTMLVVADGPF